MDRCGLTNLTAKRDGGGCCAHLAGHDAQRVTWPRWLALWFTAFMSSSVKAGASCLARRPIGRGRRTRNVPGSLHGDFDSFSLMVRNAGNARTS
jgi:hypothetical protein